MTWAASKRASPGSTSPAGPGTPSCRGPLDRAAHSAEIIAGTIGAAGVRRLPHLVERDYGESAGMTATEIASRWPEGNVPGIESRESIIERARGALAALALEYAGRRVIVVSHGGFINTVLSIVSNGEIGSGKTTLANACLSLIRYENGTWVVDEYNSVGHLVGRP